MISMAFSASCVPCTSAKRTVRRTAGSFVSGSRTSINSKRDLINLQNDRLRNRVALLLALGISPQATDAAPEI